MKRKEFRKAALAWMLAIAMVMPNSSMAAMAAEPDVQNIVDSTTEPQENGDEENRVEESAPTTEEGEDADVTASPETTASPEETASPETTADPVTDETPQLLKSRKKRHQKLRKRHCLQKLRKYW